MTPRLLPLLLALAIAALLPPSAGCRVDEEAFQAKLYSCNPNAADPACGKDGQGAPMACVAAYQLGGRNFCASGCDRKVGRPEGDELAICLPSGAPNAGLLSGARLRKCNPEVASSCGNPELSCLRTDLVKSEGVCMSVSPCARHADCRDPVRSTCMGEMLRETYGDKAQLKSDHTYCLQGGCRANRTACSPGETCLRDVIPKASNPADICVPNCDANHNCPPNYFCYPDLYSRISPPVCIPGLLGLRCRTRLDCLVGDCVDSGAGFNVCTVPCSDDNDCAKHDSEQGTFFCAPGGDGKKWCQGHRAYRGSLCNTTADCHSPGEICASLSADSRVGLCLFPCKGDGTCTAYAGVAHTCLPQIKDGAGNPSGPPVCWPGSFGQPCRSDEQCIGSVRGGLRDLSCKPTGAGKPNICTVLCLSDDDCRANRFTKEGWCATAGEGQAGLCVPPFADDAACERDSHCESKKCITVPGAMAKRCDKTPGY